MDSLSASSDDQPTNDICKICLKVVAKYTCPKCDIRYCSVACYQDKKHLRCSENFYKDWCVEQMKQQKGSKEDKEKMIEILKRLQEESQSLDDPCDDTAMKSLEERLDGLDLDKDSELVWEQLTAEEKEEFQKMLNDGRIGHLLESYTPWWKCERNHVVELSSPGDVSTPFNPHPPIPNNLPPLSHLLKVQPSPLLKYNVVNVLYSYVYTVRLFNGSHMELFQQAIEALFQLSAVLSSSAVFRDCNSAISDVIARSQQHKEVSTSLEFAYAAMLDVSSIIGGSSSGSHDHSLVSHALSDLHHMIQVRCDQVKVKGKGTDSSGVITSKTLRELERKMFFLLVWSMEHVHDIIPLEQVIELEHEGHIKQLQEHREMESKVEKGRKDNKTVHSSTATPQLIEEL